MARSSSSCCRLVGVNFPEAIKHLAERAGIEGEETGPRVIIEDRQGLKVMSGRAEDPLSLPEGRYRLQILNDDREVVKSKRFRIRAGRTSRLGPFRTE